MTIIELEINCLRGIKNLKLNLNGENALIYGDNGTGKSGVADAVDFLFEGNISRLQGTGAGALDLQKHGKHICSDDNDAWVKAKIKLPNVDSVINIERKLNAPKILICPPEHKDELERITQMAKLQSHFLSRREILVFISSTGKDRAEGIEKILNLQSIEDSRKLLTNISNDYGKSFKTKKETADANRATISQLLNASESDWLNIINEMRCQFGADCVGNILDDLLAGINYSKNDAKKNEISKQIENINTIINAVFNGSRSLTSLLNSLNDICLRLETVLTIKDEIDSIALYEKGQVLIKGDVCPLCDQHVDAEKLRNNLAKKIEDLNFVKQQNSVYTTLSSQIKAIVQSDIIMILKNLVSIKEYDPTNQFEILLVWSQNLLKQLDGDSIITSKEILRLNTDLPLRQKLDEVADCITKHSVNLALDKYAKTYSELSAIKEHLAIYNHNSILSEQAKIQSEKSRWLLDNFNKVLTEQLNIMYLSVQDRFDELYRIMHVTDEGNFKSSFDRKPKSLELSVEFHDGKMYPPNAVHSEGHQDSMGICLFLALSEKISDSTFNLIVLDDVVMSIDIDHRKSFCRILAEQFPNKQFIITTHDIIWRKELEYLKIVDRKNIFHFRSWDYEHGPYYTGGDNIWNSVTNELNAGKKNEAIGLLRYYMEETFSDICSKYKLKVPYSHSAKWTLSETIQPAYKFFKDALDAAVKSARHFKRDETKQLTLLTKFKDTYATLRAEEWALNPCVHFTIWAQSLSQSELRDLIQAVKDFCEMFFCPTCNSYIDVNVDMNYNATSLSCKCGEYCLSCLIT